MKKSMRFRIFAGMAGCFLLLITSSWREGPAPDFNGRFDTVPAKVFDLQKEQIGQLSLQLAQASLDSLPDIARQLQQVLADIDPEKIKATVDAALATADLDRMQAEMKRAFDGLDPDKAKAKPADRMNQEEIQKELERVREELAKARLHLNEILGNKQWRTEMKEYRQKINKAEMERALERASQELEKLKNL